MNQPGAVNWSTRISPTAKSTGAKSAPTLGPATKPRTAKTPMSEVKGVTRSSSAATPTYVCSTTILPPVQTPPRKRAATTTQGA